MSSQQRKSVELEGIVTVSRRGLVTGVREVVEWGRRGEWGWLEEVEECARLRLRGLCNAAAFHFGTGRVEQVKLTITVEIMHFCVSAHSKGVRRRGVCKCGFQRVCRSRVLLYMHKWR